MSQALSRQAFFFLCVGAGAAAVHFLALWLCVDGLGIPPLWGNVLAFIPAFAWSFLGHYRLTFRATHGRGLSWRHSLWRWLLSALGGFALNQGLFALGLKVWGAQAYTLVWLAATLIVTVLTFALGKLWAFRAAP